MAVHKPPDFDGTSPFSVSGCVYEPWIGVIVPLLLPSSPSKSAFSLINNIQREGTTSNVDSQFFLNFMYEELSR